MKRTRKAARREPADEAEAAYRQKCIDLKNAWKPARRKQLALAGMRPSDPDWPYACAVLSWANRRGPGPMLDLIEAGRLSDAQRREVVALLRGLLMPRQPKKGNPGGVHTRWGRPRYLCALRVEQRMAAWRRENAVRKVSAAVMKGFIAEEIRKINDWAIMKGRRPLDPDETSADFQRVERILRDPKRLRL